jgi:hypothetical protein
VSDGPVGFRSRQRGWQGVVMLSMARRAEDDQLLQMKILLAMVGIRPMVHLQRRGGLAQLTMPPRSIQDIPPDHLPVVGLQEFRIGHGGVPLPLVMSQNVT